jgi:eukaryotic-like serine/threonine-protein kinase
MNTNPGRIDKYELQERLGQSGMAEVWKAFDTQAHRYVAIKLLHANLKTDPDFVTRFQREAQVIASLRHPNIVQCYDFSISQFPETASAAAYVVMDYVDGGTLADYTRNTSHEGKVLPIADVVRLFSSIGMAIDYAHQQRVVHGNLKPANILLDKRNTSRNAFGEPMVTDFGMTKLMGAAVGSTSGSWNTTPLYMSPEQVMGSPANERSDIYSLGIMLYEMCTGTLPFLGSNPATIMMQHVNTIPAFPALINPKLPPALSTVIMRSIAKDPSERFPSASALVAALADVTRQEEQEAFTISTPEIVGQPAGPVNPMDMPTVLSPRLSPLPAGIVPSASASGFSSNMPVGGISQPYPLVQPGGPITPMLPAYTPTYTAGNLPAGISMQPPPAPTSKKPGRRGLLIALAALLILALVGSGLGAYFAFFSKGATTTAPLIVGHAYFVSSGLLSPDSKEGITDQLQINLENVSPPQSGKSYYAWLLNDKNLDWRPIFLGQLAFNNGTLNLFYPGDALHSNLLATNSRFLITEEDAAVPPTSPSLDPATWVYYAEFSQKLPSSANPMSTPASSMSTPTGSMSTPASSMSTPTGSMSTPASSMTMSSFSLYDHIRHLLAAAPALQAVGLTGGLDTWAYRNTQKILEWSGSARDSWKIQNAGSSAFIHRQLTRIMDYLDGASFVQKDLPAQNLLADPNYSKVGLLTFNPQTQDPTGFLYEMGVHLYEMSLLPETSAEQKALAIQINQAINEVNLWFQTIHEDVQKLFPMTDAQLFGSEGRNLLNDVATLANYAFAGKVDPHAQVMDGIVQIHYDVQRIATFNIRACTASVPCALS